MPFQTDLLLSKEKILENWCKQRGFFSKADLMAYGLQNYYLRADRTIREWVVEGKVKHLSKDECLFRNLIGKMAWYIWIGQ